MPNTNSHFINSLALSTLDGTMGATFNGVAANDFSGCSVASAGDVNGDGFDDLVIGAYQAAAGGLSWAGSTYLIFGHTGIWSSSLALATLNGTNGVVINGIAPGDQSGVSVASAGDVNGDGIDDIIIAAANVASTYLIFGHTGIWSSPLVLSTLNGTNGVMINGIIASSVASAGDVNGDGIDDIVIGPSRFSNGDPTYLVFGHTGVWTNPLVLGSLNASNGVVINGITAYDRAGWSVASAGDVNGDGISDVVIGAPYASSGRLSGTGSVYLIFGHTGVWSSPLGLGSLNGTTGVIIPGVIAGGSIGRSVASAGDVNGDGVDDILIGAPQACSGSPSFTATYLIFGYIGAWSSPLGLGSLNGTNGVIINSILANDGSGASVASAGDVNGDGVDDMLLGAPFASNGGLAQAGSTYLILGNTGAWITPFELSSLNGSNGVIINGILAGDRSGTSVASAGDVNGDGVGDILVGAPNASPSGIGFLGSGSTCLIFGDSLDLLINSLTINQGQTIFLNNSMLMAVHPHNFALNASIPFSISNVMHGAFSTLNFFQNELSQNLVSFTHDGSIYEPSFEVTVGNWAMTSPVAAIINFAVPPILYITPFSVEQGKTVILTNQSIRATSLYFPSDALMFSVSNVLYGNFVKTNTTTIENQFNQSVLTQGQIAFATDGGVNAPSYNISVSNGRFTTSTIHATVNFNTPPILLNNQLTLKLGQQKVVLSGNELSASDTMFEIDKLIFTPSTLNCHFENINLPDTALPLFLQKNIEDKQILFVWDGYSSPAYNISVSDGILSTTGPASITLAPASNITSVLAIETTNSSTIIGSVVGAVGMIGLLFFGAQWYWKEKNNNQLQKILSEGISDTEKAFNAEIVRPIANKIFNIINTTGFFGQRSEADTKAYMMAIGEIVSELKRQNANLNFNEMEPVDKEAFINEIANQAHQQSLPKYNGYCGRCTRYFKAEASPQEIEQAAEGIALASAAWQKRHMGGVSAKNTNFGIKLETIHNIGFSEEAANEGVSPEKQFKLMQNHIKMMEQRAQEQQQEQKRLEEQLAERERELVSFRQQGTMFLNVAKSSTNT